MPTAPATDLALAPAEMRSLGRRIKDVDDLSPVWSRAIANPDDIAAEMEDFARGSIAAEARWRAELYAE